MTRKEEEEARANFTRFNFERLKKMLDEERAIHEETRKTFRIKLMDSHTILERVEKDNEQLKRALQEVRNGMTESKVILDFVEALDAFLWETKGVNVYPPGTHAHKAFEVARPIIIKLGSYMRDR